MSGVRAFPRAPGRLKLGLLAICLAQFLALLDGLIVSVALPPMAADLGLTAGGAQWVLNAYAVPFAGLLLLGGRLADTLGRRRAFFVGQFLLVAGGVVGGMAGTSALVYAARMIQAGGAALAMPAAVAMLAALFPDEAERARAFSLLTVGGGIGWVSAGLFGGVLAEAFGWRSVFLVTVPISALAIGAALLGLPAAVDAAREDEGPRGVDWSGALLVVGALGTLILSLGRVEQAGWTSAATLGGVAGGLLLGVALVARERRAANPVLRLDLLRLPQVRGSALLGILLTVGMVGSQFLGSLFLQDVLGYGTGRAGLAFVPLAIMPLLMAPAVARLHPRFGPGRTIAAGFALSGSGLALLVPGGPGTGYPTGVLPAFVLLGVGLTLVYVPLAVTSVAGVRQDEYGVATAVFSTANQVGGALALAVLATVITAAVGDTELAGVPPDQAMEGLRAAFGVSAALLLLGAALALPLLRRVPAGADRDAIETEVRT